MSVPKSHTPANCFVCNRRATGMGAGDGRDPKWLCAECLLMVRDIKAVKNFDGYETNAVTDCVNALGRHLEGLGKTDLADFDDFEARLAVECVIREFGDSLRRQIRENRAPF